MANSKNIFWCTCIMLSNLIVGCASLPDKTKNTQQYLSEAQNYLNQNQPQQAIEISNQVLKINPNDYYPFWIKAKAYQQLSDNSNALNNYHKAIKLNPQNIELITNYASYLCNTKNYQDADSQFQISYQLAQANRQSLTNVYVDDAHCLNSQNKLDDAIEYYQKALSDSNPPPAAYLGISYTYILQQNYQQATYYIYSYPGPDTTESLGLKIMSLRGLLTVPLSKSNQEAIKNKIEELQKQLAQLKTMTDTTSAGQTNLINQTSKINNTNNTNQISNQDQITKPDNQLIPVNITKNNSDETKPKINRSTVLIKAIEPQSEAVVKSIPVVNVNNYSKSKLNISPKFAKRIKISPHGKHYIIVEPGDTLYQLALSSKISSKTIITLNHLKTQNVPLGVKLFLD